MVKGKASLLERVLINWAMLVDYITYRIPLMLGYEFADRKSERIVKENGLLKGICKIKISDYERLVDISSRYDGIPDRVSRIFNKAPCGIGMKLVYGAFRR